MDARRTCARIPGYHNPFARWSEESRPIHIQHALFFHEIQQKERFHRRLVEFQELNDRVSALFGDALI